MSLYRGPMKMLSDLISPKALERILADAARDRQTTLNTLDIATLQDILKRDIYKRLQLSIPASLAKRRVQEVLDSLGEEQVMQPVTSLSTQIVTLEDQAKQFALYFDWPETQRLRAVLSVARQTTAEGRNAETLLIEGAELVESLERKLSEGLVTQGQDLSELKASAARLGSIGGPKVKRLETLIKQISEAQNTRMLLPAEVERALALTLTLRKQVESSVVQQLGPDQKREMNESLGRTGLAGAGQDGAGLGGAGQDEFQPFDLSLLTPEAQARVQALEREHETRLLTELARDYQGLLRLNTATDQELQTLRERLAAGQVLGEPTLSAFKERLAAARTEAAAQQQGQLAALSARLSALAVQGGENDGSVQGARQGLSLAEGTLQAGGLVTDEVAQLSELVGTLENSDSVARERLMTLQRETFELERRARELPAALADLAGPLEAARATLASGQVADLEPLWTMLERRMGEAAQQREDMDTRALRVMHDYDRYRNLAGETIQKLGRLADVLRGQQKLGVLSSDARSRYLQTLESAEALLTEAEAEFEAARQVTATFGADALSNLLGVFDTDSDLFGTGSSEAAAPAASHTAGLFEADAFDDKDSASELLSTSSFAAPPAVSLLTEPGAGAGTPDVPASNNPFNLGTSAAVSVPTVLATTISAASVPMFGAAGIAAALGVASAEVEESHPHAHSDSGISGPILRAWRVQNGQVTEGDLSPAGSWHTETDCEADVLRLAWLADQTAELSPLRLLLEVADHCWMTVLQPNGSVLVVYGPDQASAQDIAAHWSAESP